MKRRLHKKYLILILGYSVLLLLIPYVLDYRGKTIRDKHEVQQQKCPDFEKTLAMWSNVDNSNNATEMVGDASNRSDRINIYLHATWRTGSSFLGELFNQHPDVFYLYEPMWNMWQSLYPGDAVSLQGAVRDMMNSLFRCDFSVLKLYAGTSNITTSFIFGWKTNKVICSEPLCSAYKKDEIGLVRGDVCDKCRPRDLKDLERECKKYRVMVIKDVRVFDLSVLVPLIRDPGLNLRVIQLFRDPRAVHNSRLKSKLALVKESVQVLRSKKQTDKFKRLLMPSNRSNRAENYVASAMELICDSWLNDMLLVANAPQWLKRNYIQIRYEDLVLYPVEELQRLYRFSNLTSFPKIEKFVVNMTRGEGYSSEKPFVISSRDAKEAIFAWRERLNVEQINRVEAYCSEVMSRLGYQSVVDKT
ncbi:carbohydrate sulfotransferase 7 [Anguilla rostrata]|uniref:carbohydrate sulfotransferase 7 n=1 Tax=Anguilla anguilla TaxID=7936 RepID=UPI0015ADC23F|nr:carbohydrate sulfotransferase 7 [Anguilla anguilla]XP_035266630.1 carbohydrate sulfotransferase 7 [Anguilla anguilla]